MVSNYRHYEQGVSGNPHKTWLFRGSFYSKYLKVFISLLNTRFTALRLTARGLRSIMPASRGTPDAFTPTGTRDHLPDIAEPCRQKGEGSSLYHRPDSIAGHRRWELCRMVCERHAPLLLDEPDDPATGG